MPTTPRPILRLVLLASLLPVSACAAPASVKPIFPPAADLAAPPKPVLSVEALASEKALNDHDIAVEAWGESMALQINRLCRFFASQGMKISCPLPDG